jgi:hypothetical protein
MDEYSRILIEEYCMSHPKTKKSRILKELVEGSYDLEYMPSDAEAIYLEKLIAREKDPELREALKDLDDFLFV